MQKPRVLVADDHRITLVKVKDLLEQKFDVVGMAEDGQALLDIAEEQQPDVLVVDISMPVLNGIDAAARYLRSHPEAKVIFLTNHREPSVVERALAAGASGYVAKLRAAEELIPAIEQAIEGRRFLSPLVTENSRSESS